MKFIKLFFVIFSLTLVIVTNSALAGSSDPLFINLTSDDAHRSSMAIGFGVSQMKLGHPLTIFLNDKGVLIGSKQNAVKFSEHQKLLTDIISKGATVLICPTCSKHYAVDQKDFLQGIKLGNPEMTGGALFKDNTKTMTW
jgi:sulfur relay (sulfurtransferase) complex TusBCD TusD component (DsrE family)